MSDFKRDSASVHLRVTDWVQTIANSIDSEDSFLSDPPGLTLKANCLPSNNSISLSSNEDFSKFRVEVYISEAPFVLGKWQAG